MVRATRRHAPPPIGAILSILWQLADALDHAHSQFDRRGLPMAVVHGDLSPANILIDHRGCVRLTDFGASLAVASDLETQVALMRVRYGYLSPEAVRLGHIDPRADLFALGSVAHELLSGRPLFAGSNHVETLARLFKAPIPAPSAEHPGAGPGVDALVFRALERDPTRRWQSAAEMRDRLTRLRLDSRGPSGVRAVAEWASGLTA
jgi:serine/threonine-protein kinase